MNIPFHPATQIRVALMQLQQGMLLMRGRGGEGDGNKRVRAKHRVRGREEAKRI